MLKTQTASLSKFQALNPPSEPLIKMSKPFPDKNWFLLTSAIEIVSRHGLTFVMGTI
jgi:hypothetical protein